MSQSSAEKTGKETYSEKKADDRRLIKRERYKSTAIEVITIAEEKKEFSFAVLGDQMITDKVENAEEVQYELENPTAETVYIMSAIMAERLIAHKVKLESLRDI